jgi:uncharacterized protein YkwD
VSRGRRWLRASLVSATGLLAILALVAPPLAAQESDPHLSALQTNAGALDRINSYRALAGVSPATTHPALMHSAAGHVAYYDLNRADPSLAGMGLHDQRPDAVGFSGASMGDRARAAGYPSAAVTENAGFGGLDAAIEWHMNTVNHRLPLIHPSALDMGMAASDVSGFNIIQVGLRRDPSSTSLPSVYPPDGATGVPVSWDGAEAPDPAPGVRRPLGYPLTAAFGVSQRIEWRTIELRNAAGEILESSALRKEWMRAVAIIPHRPLEPGQTYTATIEAVADGRAVSRTWRFATAG